MGRVIVLALIVAAIIWGLRMMMRSGHIFEIRVDREGVRLKGSVPGRRNGDIIEFFAGLRLTPGSRIQGMPDGHGFRLVFNQDVSPGLQQRIRNYLMLKP